MNIIPKVPKENVPLTANKSKPPLTSRSLTTSPRSARSSTQPSSNNACIYQSTPKSIKISTKNYDIFVHEKANTKEATPEDLVESAEMTRLFVKFLKASKFKVPSFLTKIEKSGNSFIPGGGSEGGGFLDSVGAKERIKSYGGDKSMA